MKSAIKKIGKYILVATVGALGISTALATDISVIQDATTKVEQSHDNLLNINDSDTLTADQKIAAEIDARRNLVLDAVSLSAKEIDGLKDKLSKLPKFGDNTIEKDLQDQYTAELDVYTGYYSDKADVVKDLATSDDIKAAAKEISEYRDNVYSPAIERIVDFTFVFYNEDAISTSSTSLTKKSSNLNKIEKANLFNVSSIRTKLDKASDLIKTANIKYIKARNLVIIKTSPKTDTTTSDTHENATTTATTTDGVIPEKTPSPRELMSSSLNDIKAVYDIFLQISKDTKKLIGTK